MASPAFTQELYYKHSGRFAAVDAAIATFYGLLLAIPCAWVYAWLIRWNPFIYISCLASLAFGGLLGYATESFLEKRHVRSVPVAAVVGTIVTLVGLYFSWAVWVHALTGIGSVSLALQPLGLWEVIGVINQKGAWSFRSSTPTGLVLWIVWAVEASIIVGFGVYLCAHEMMEATFCENCTEWTKVKEGALVVAAGSRPTLDDKAAMKAYEAELKRLTGELRRRLENKDFSQLQPVPADAIAWFALDLHSCPKCSLTNTLRLNLKRFKIEGKAVKDSIDEKEIFRQLLLSSSEVDAINKLGEKLAPQLPKLMKPAAEPAKSGAAAAGQ